MKILETLEVGLCAERHEMPVKDYIFGNIINPSDVDHLFMDASDRLEHLAEASNLKTRKVTLMPCGNVDYADCNVERYDAVLVIYVTGCTPALVATLDAAMTLFAGVELMHYDKNTGKYFRQELRGYATR